MLVRMEVVGAVIRLRHRLECPTLFVAPHSDGGWSVGMRRCLRRGLQAIQPTTAGARITSEVVRLAATAEAVRPEPSEIAGYIGFSLGA